MWNMTAEKNKRLVEWVMRQLLTGILFYAISPSILESVYFFFFYLMIKLIKLPFKTRPQMGLYFSWEK